MGDDSRECDEKSVGRSTIVFERRPERRRRARGAAGGVQARRALIGPLGFRLGAPCQGGTEPRACAESSLRAGQFTAPPLAPPAHSLVDASVSELSEGFNACPGGRSGLRVLAPVTSRFFSEACPTAGVRLRKRRGPSGKVGAGAGQTGAGGDGGREEGPPAPTKPRERLQ